MKRSAKILLIEDEKDQRDLLRSMLSSEKYQIKECASAEEALDLLEKEDVDLIVSDLRLTGISGADFVEELRQWNSTTPVIFVSGYGKEQDWTCAVQNHAFALITKPYKRETLLKAVQSAIQERSALHAI